MPTPLDLFDPDDNTVDPPHSRFHDSPCERVDKCVSCRRQMSKEWFCKRLKTSLRLKRSGIPFSLTCCIKYDREGPSVARASKKSKPSVLMDGFAGCEGVGLLVAGEGSVGVGGVSSSVSLSQSSLSVGRSR